MEGGAYSSESHFGMYVVVVVLVASRPGGGGATDAGAAT